MKKILIVLLIIVLGVVAWFWGKGRIWAPDKAQAQYRLTKVERKDMVNTVSATGALSAVVTVEVGTEVSGQIKELLVDFNSPVNADQIIARIDPESYETLLRQAEAELAVARAQLNTRKTEIQRDAAELENAQANWLASQAQARKAKVTLADAQRNLERQKALVAQDFVAKNEFDKAQTAYQEAVAQLEQAQAQEQASKSKVSSAQAGLAIARAQIKEAEASVDLRTAALDKRKVDLENTIIRSPVDGVVIDRNVDVGQTVAASLSAPTLFTIAQDLSKMEVSTYVDEADIGRIKEGQTARFTVDAFGTKQFSGQVRQVRKMGKSVQNVVTYEVIISADNQDMTLMPGMTADVEIELLKRPQVLVVANTALRFTPPDAKPNASDNAQPGFAGGFQNASGGGPPGGRPDPEARIKELTERLNLSESQQAELRKIFQQMGEQMRAAFQSGGPGGPGGMGALRDKIRKESQTAITRILDAQQRKLYAEMGAQDQPQRGKLWRLDASGQPEALDVVLGVSDSSDTEISGPQIQEGLEVIIGQGQ